MATKQSKPTKQTQASKRLLKKISALRATLPADERKVLDSLIVTEVQAHRFALKKPAARAGATKPAARAYPGTKDQVDEAKAHISRAKGGSPRMTDRKEHGVEVQGHLLRDRAVPNKAAESKYGTKEVDAHLVKMRSVSSKTAATRNDPKEVSAHKFTRRAALGKHSGKADADEVRAHVAKSKATQAKLTNNRAIVFDKASQEYKLAD